MTRVKDYIYHQEESDSQWERGFYFVDETEDLEGPYPSEDEASSALKLYCEYLNSGPSEAFLSIMRGLSEVRDAESKKKV